MPEDMFRRVPLRLSTSATIVAVCLCAAPALAQDAAQPAVNDREVQAFFNGIARDQQLDEQYSSAAPPTAVNRQSAPTPTALDEPLDQALDDAVVADGEELRTAIALAPPSLLQTVLLTLASLGVIAFAGSVLWLAVRELKKDARQRKHNYRRRVKHRDSSAPAHAS